MAFDDEEETASPERLAGLNDAVEQRVQPDLCVPDLASRLSAWPSERVRMLGARDGSIRVVVQDGDSGPQNTMICAFEGSSMLTVLRRFCGHVCGAERSVRPIQLSHPSAHFAPTSEEC